MDKKQIVDNTIKYVKEVLKGAEGGHDWWHIKRVYNLAKHIAKSEEADLLIIKLGSLLHDIADSKFHDGDEEVRPKTAEEFLKKQDINEEDIKHIKNIIKYISFKGGNHKQTFKSPELDIVQDADRLDAMGAIGIARAFNFGGHKNKEIYNPNIKPNLNMTKEEYKKADTPSVNHFHEKLLLLKDRMNTRTGRQIAEHRHKFMEQYLDEFYNEWDGKV